MRKRVVIVGGGPAMLTALLAVKNILGESHDVWGVNTAHEYLEVQPNPSAD